ncbi:MAG: sulfatase-like hydrolase/transferase [Deltaproteobacteria bacterium]|nr:sulfatase-like hydrolase/transferase [Deltaproteobacteria bacterium]
MSASAVRQWPGRIARGLLGGAIACVVVALIDAALALGSLTDRSRAPGLLQLWLADLGLIAPAALASAFAFACGAIAVHPGGVATWSGLRAWLKPESERDRVGRGIVAPLVIVGLGAWIVSTANLSRTLMSRVELARASGAAIGAAAVLSGLVVVALVLIASAGLIETVSARSSGLASLKPSLTLPAGIAVSAAVLAWGIASGTTSGDGGMLGIFGVLKRPELDLKAPGLLLLAGLFAWGAGTWLRKLWAPAALVIALLPLGLTVRTAKALDDDTRSGATIEGYAPLGRPCLRLARKLTDRDHDGAARYFGGGDCNDRNPDVNPMASDVPNNGIDEDCSGADLVVQVPANDVAPQAQAPTDSKGRIPADLNVLLITIDTLRWDTGYAGYERPTTPSVDKLAAKSTVFDTFYSLATYTGKSIGPLMSGKYPSETSRGWSHYNSYPKTDRMVQERLKAGGIRTIAVHSHWYFKGWSGMGRGFDVLDMSASPSQGVDATEDATSSADRLSDAAIKVLGKPENTSKRFFAWVHYFDPHAEYVHHKGTMEFGPKMRDKYDHEVRFTDDQVGRLIDFVSSQPWGANTAIIVSSDHGEAFGEHGMIRHGFEVWEELCRVPFVLYVPGVPPKHIKARRSAIDMVPTILDLFQTRIETPKDKWDFVSGVSLLPEALLPAGQEPPPRDVLVDMPAGPNNDERRAFIHGDMKLTISNGVRYQLFNLAQDPGEKNDLADDKAALKAARASYDAFRVRLREIKVKRPEDE